jgi:hypothetical protein
MKEMAQKRPDLPTVIMSSLLVGKILLEVFKSIPIEEA